MIAFTPQEDRYVSREELKALLTAWSTSDDSAVTCSLPPHASLPDHLDLPEQALTPAERSSTGAVVFWSPAHVRVVLPPFPIENAQTLRGWDAGPLRDVLERRRRIGVLLLRLGRFAVGIYDDGELVISKTGTRLVHGRHRKGGSSSARFARRREGQAQVLFDAACETFRQRVEEYVGPLDHVVLGGERQTLLGFRKACPFMERVDELILPRLLDVREPSRKELDRVPRLLYQSRVLGFWS